MRDPPRTALARCRSLLGRHLPYLLHLFGASRPYLFKLTQLIIWPHHGRKPSLLDVLNCGEDTVEVSVYCTASLQSLRRLLELYTRRATGGRDTEQMADLQQCRLAVENRDKDLVLAVHQLK